jgi:hypothetical protein
VLTKSGGGYFITEARKKEIGPYALFFRCVFWNEMFVGVVIGVLFNIIAFGNVPEALICGGMFLCARMMYLGFFGIGDNKS